MPRVAVLESCSALRVLTDPGSSLLQEVECNRLISLLIIACCISWLLLSIKEVGRRLSKPGILCVWNVFVLWPEKQYFIKVFSEIM